MSTSEKSKSKALQIIFTILMWILTAVLVLLTITYIYGSAISFIFSAVAAVICAPIPSLQKQLKKLKIQKWIKVLVVIALVFISLLLIPTAEKLPVDDTTAISNDTNEDNTSTITEPETNVTETTAPETTAPETTAPETTAPETTAPETTALEITQPIVVETVAQTDPPSTTAPVEQASVTEDISSKYDITITNAPGTVHRNEIASLTIQGAPNTEYRLRIRYKSGWSEADGLGLQTSNDNGTVTWTWKVGGKTSFGTWDIEITGNGQTVRTDFTVAE